MAQKKSRSHKKRVKARHSTPEGKKEKSKVVRYILFAVGIILCGLLLFRVFCVEKVKTNATISILEVNQIARDGTNTYYRFGKTGSHHVVLKYPAIYEIRAITDSGEEIIFETTDPDAFYCRERYDIEYTTTTVFGKSKITDVERLHRYITK